MRLRSTQPNGQRCNRISLSVDIPVPRGFLLSFRLHSVITRFAFRVSRYCVPCFQTEYLKKNHRMQDETTLKNTFSKRLARAISEKSLTQRELSVTAKIAQSAISKYMSEKGLPNTMELYKIAMILEVSTDWLLGRDSTPQASAKSSTTIVKLKAKIDAARNTLESAMQQLHY